MIPLSPPLFSSRICHIHNDEISFYGKIHIFACSDFSKDRGVPPSFSPNVVPCLADSDDTYIFPLCKIQECHEQIAYSLTVPLICAYLFATNFICERKQRKIMNFLFRLYPSVEHMYFQSC